MTQATLVQTETSVLVVCEDCGEFAATREPAEARAFLTRHATCER